ncbi:hypothetical protein DFA_08120 [Cavenderia fasciculata]|uniref:PWWP domain-containing protein n=1 Tax=Cavenderia fasciculata TaxID=261658 RepID=F4Q579_CACFS|nr:uncharacterized protein DFA_08120 [Cavenderia fasciculata]EGG17138.1 hypothetical protein DFA_08120 [Cavenderia fasciculata]|eukprot:XP_004355622.1 hypothetical protein DFA_08120 [Cavenderia fasciculata]
MNKDVGQLIMARLNYWWPARICTRGELLIHQRDGQPNNKYVPVFFFGFNQGIWIKMDDIKEYTVEMSKDFKNQEFPYDWINELKDVIIGATKEVDEWNNQRGAARNNNGGQKKIQRSVHFFESVEFMGTGYWNLNRDLIKQYNNERHDHHSHHRGGEEHMTICDDEDDQLTDNNNNTYSHAQHGQPLSSQGDRMTICEDDDDDNNNDDNDNEEGMEEKAKEKKLMNINILNNKPDTLANARRMSQDDIESYESGGVDSSEVLARMKRTRNYPSSTSAKYNNNSNSHQHQQHLHQHQELDNNNDDGDDDVDRDDDHPTFHQPTKKQKPTIQLARRSSTDDNGSIEHYDSLRTGTGAGAGQDPTTTSTTSPLLNSQRRSLLIKPPPRSPSINTPTSTNTQQQQQQRIPRPVLIANNNNNNNINNAPVSSQQQQSTITCITRPPGSSPTIRSITSPVIVSTTSSSSSYLTLGNKSGVTASSPILSSKTPSSILPKRSPVLGSTNGSRTPTMSGASLSSLQPPATTGAAASPLINPKTPITLSIPRIQKKTVGPTPTTPHTNSVNSSTGGIVSPSMTSQQQAAAISSPFQLPQQYRKNVFPSSPSLRIPTNIGGVGGVGGVGGLRFPPSPLMPVGPMSVMTPPLPGNPMMSSLAGAGGGMGGPISDSLPKVPGSSEDDGGGVTIIPNPNHPTGSLPGTSVNIPNTSTPILAQGYPMVPFLSIPPFSLNNSVNMETVFNSPFSGKLSVKGGTDVGFHVECSIMGKTFSGYLTEAIMPPNVNGGGLAPGLPTQTSVPPPPISGMAPPPKQMHNPFQIPTIPPSAIQPNQLRSNDAIPYYDYHFVETYRQWQEMMIKNQMQRYQQQQQQPVNNNTNKPPTASHNNNNNNNNVNSSTNSTPQYIPKSVPSRSTSSTTSSVSEDKESANESSLEKSGGDMDSKAPNIVLTGGDSPTSSGSGSGSVEDNPQFQHFKQNAFQKLEQYQKLQILNLLAKQEENIGHLSESVEKEKASIEETANGDEKEKEKEKEKLLASLQLRFKEENDKLFLIHKEERAKLDSTHSYQASKFHREVEKQWALQQAKFHGHSHGGHSNSGDGQSKVGSIPSPLGSPALTPFISPSPSPSPSLSSFLGHPAHSPLISSFALLKSGNNFSHSGNINNNNSNNSSGSSNHHHHKSFALNGPSSSSSTTTALAAPTSSTSTSTLQQPSLNNSNNSISNSSSSNSTPVTNKGLDEKVNSSSNNGNGEKDDLGSSTSSLNEAHLPPLSLSSNSPPRSPNSQPASTTSSTTTTTTIESTEKLREKEKELEKEKEKEMEKEKEKEIAIGKESIKSSNQPNPTISIES